MKRAVLIAGLLLFGSSGPAASASDSSAVKSTQESKGTTVDDLGRGLKSAAQNVEREIPKLGSAIGNAVKKMTEKGPDKQAAQEKQKK
jgi:hypothetical protein